MSDFTSDDVDNLYKSLGLTRASQEPPTPEVSALSRSGMALANFPSNVANALTNVGQQIVLPAEDRKLNLVPKIYNPPLPTTFAQKAVDVVGEQFLPQAAAFAVPYTGIAKLAGAAGLVGTGAEMLAQGGAGAIMSPDHPISGALTGAGLGAVSNLSRAARILPLTGMIGASTLYDTLQGQDVKSAAIQNAVQFGFGLLPGQHVAADSLSNIAKPEAHYTPTELDTMQHYDEPPAPAMRLANGNENIQNPSYGVRPTVLPSTEHLNLLPNDYVPSVQESQITNYPDTSGMRLQTGEFQPSISEGGINGKDVSTRGMFLKTIDSDRINRALGVDQVDPNLQDLNSQLALLQEAKTQSPSQPSEINAPTVEDLGLHQKGTRRAFAAAKTIESENPILPVETNIVEKVKAENTPEVIQGPALFDPNDKAVLAKGVIGQGHMDLYGEGYNNLGVKYLGQEAKMPEVEHGFHTNEGNILNRIESADLLLKNKQITPEIHEALMSKKMETGLSSGDFEKYNIQSPKTIVPETRGKIQEDYNNAAHMVKMAEDMGMTDHPDYLAAKEKMQIAEEKLKSFQQEEAKPQAKSEGTTAQIAEAIKLVGKKELINRAKIWEEAQGRLNSTTPEVGLEWAAKHTANGTWNNLPFVKKSESAILQEQKIPSVTKQVKQMKKPSGNNNSGQISAPVMFALGRASVGAIAGGSITYKETDGDWKAALGGALLGAGAFALADPRIIKSLASVPAKELEIIGTKPAKALVQSESEGLKKLAQTPLVDLAGQAINNRGTYMAKIARSFEVLSNRLVPSAWVTSNSIAQGAVEAIAKTVSDAWKEMKNYAPNTDVIERVGKYFNGQLTDKSEVQKLVSSEGGMDHNTWLKSKKDERAGLTSIWRIGEPIGDPALDNANLLHVSQDTRDKLVNMENTELFRNLTGTDLAFVKAAQAPRLAMNAYQQMIANALPEDAQLHSIIENSTQQYITRRFAIFNGFKPTNEQVSAAAKQFGLKEGSAILQDAQVKGNAYSSQSFHAAIQDAPNDPKWAHFQTLEHEHQIAPGSDATEKQNWMVTPETLEKYKVSTDDDYTHNFIEQYLKNTQEGKQLYGMNVESGGLDTKLLKEREMLSPTFRELLGEYKDPVEKMGHALNAIIPMAKGAQRINALVGQTELNGLSNYYADKGEWVKVKNDLKSQIESANIVGNATAAQALQSKLNYLLTYSDAGQNLKFGVAKGGMISRALSDQLLGLPGGWGDFENAISRGMMKQVNTYSKMIHSPYNPAMHLRWIFQTPIFMAVGRVTPSRGIEAFGDLTNYLRTGKMSDNLTEAMRMGLTQGTYASGELGINFSNIASGTSDVGLLGKIHQKILETYNISDASTRMATYFSAKDRYAAKLGLDINDPQIVNKAIEFTNARTLNYDNVAPAIKLLRNIPLFNLYASYSFEIARIGKNLVHDVAYGEDLGTKIHAAATLASIAAIPEVLQRMSVANLSTQDQKDWEQTQRLAPDYSRSRYKFVTGRDANGNFHYIDYTSIVPQNDWSQTARSLASGDWKGAGAVNPIASWDNSPFLNIAAEQITGKDSHNERDFRGFQDRVSNIAREMLPSYTPGVGYDWQRWMNTGITNIRTGRATTLEGNIIRATTGLDESSVNPNLINMQAVYELKDKIQTEKQYFMDVMRTDISQDRKEHASKVFQTAIAVLMSKYQAKINK